MDVPSKIEEDFERADCSVAFHAVDLGTGEELGVHPDAPVVLASVFKVLVALEFYAQADSGELDPTQIIELDPITYTAGPTGISTFKDPVRISLRDLCQLMMSISDNTATDILVRTIGLNRINARARSCGCTSTVVESDLKTLFDGIATDLGFLGYAQLAAARSGSLGPDARRKSIDPAWVAACTALDPTTRTNRSTPRDMTRLLVSIWKGEAASPASCAKVRAVMGQQVNTRLGRGLPDGATLAAKTGTFTGCIRNEIGVITHADGRAFAVAVFTRAHTFFKGHTGIEAEMARATALAISTLRDRPAPANPIQAAMR